MTPPTERHAPRATPATSGRRRVLFATIAAGGSHVSTAEAMRDALRYHHPEWITAEVRELMVDYGFTDLDRRHKEGWKRALAHPWSIVWGQKVIDRFPSATVAFHRWLLASFAERAASELSRAAPDLVVANHGWLTVALTMAQRRFGLRVPVLTFETSTVNANALWADREAERFLVGSAVSKRRLAALGIPEERIDVVGYPVRQNFLRPPGKAEARVRLGLADRFTCLLMMGGEGIGGSLEALVDHLVASLPEMQLVVIAGRNEELRQRLCKGASPTSNVRVLGFVSEVADYLAASDVVVAKTGPATVYETLAVGRPLLAPARFGEAENKMIGLLQKHGLGAYAGGREELVQRLRSYRDAPAELEQVRRRCAELDFPGMAERLADYIAHYAASRSPLRSACDRGLALDC